VIPAIKGQQPMKSIKGKLKFIVAESEELKNAIYRLRYQVYVEEYGFEKAEDHPGGLETDDYETQSIHMAALDEAEEVVGTVRLVLHSEKGFPIEHATKINFLGEKPPPQKIAEISRLAVARTYRQRKENGVHGVESYLTRSEGGVLPDSGAVPAKNDNRVSPAIVLGLFRLTYHVSKRLGFTHWYLITEKKVWYALKKYGLVFHRIGEPVEYHGTRIPYLGIIEEIEEQMLRTNLEFSTKVFLKGLEEEYYPKKLRR
jgi:N-acyl amino acid synthase of PEP-CTERM/exosortase system